MTPQGNTFAATADVAVAAALTTIATATMGTEVPGQVVAIEVSNSGANAFTDFRIQLQDHPDGEWYDFLVAADFVGVGNSNMLFCSTDPSTLASGAKSHIHFRANAAYAFRAQAKRTTATTATVRGNWRGA